MRRSPTVPRAITEGNGECRSLLYRNKANDGRYISVPDPLSPHVSTADSPKPRVRTDLTLQLKRGNDLVVGPKARSASAGRTLLDRPINKTNNRQNISIPGPISLDTTFTVSSANTSIRRWGTDLTLKSCP